MKRVLSNLICNYYKRCPYCGYSGSDWPDSGYCLVVGKTVKQ